MSLLLLLLLVPVLLLLRLLLMMLLFRWRLVQRRRRRRQFQSIAHDGPSRESARRRDSIREEPLGAIKLVAQPLARLHSAERDLLPDPLRVEPELIQLDLERDDLGARGIVSSSLLFPVFSLYVSISLSLHRQCRKKEKNSPPAPPPFRWILTSTSPGSRLGSSLQSQRSPPRPASPQ